MEIQTTEQKNKKYEIIEQWENQAQNQRVYKIIIHMNQNMLKVQERLKQRFGISINSQSVSTSSISRQNSNINEHRQSLEQQNALLNLQRQQQNQCTQNSQGVQLQTSPRSMQQQRQSNLNQQNQPIIKIFQDFQNRGKFNHIKYSFSNTQKKLTIKLNKKFYLNQLKLRQYELIIIAQGFVKHWSQQYIQIIQVFLRYQKEFKGNTAIKFYFVSIDMLAVTIEIVYNDSKRFRFRYSLFEFRYHPLFRQRGLEQSISYIDILPQSKNSISNPNFALPQFFSDNEYYQNSKLSFMDDINNNQLLKRLISRFWVFYQIQTLNRGRDSNQYQQFNRKSLGRVYFHSVRMKKFSLIWMFNLLHHKTSSKDCGKQCSREITITFTFYLDDRDIKTDQKGNVEFKMNANIVQHDHYLTFNQKEELHYRLNLQAVGNFINKKDSSFPYSQLYEFVLNLKFDQKIGRFFSRLENIISFCIDRWAFVHYPKNQIFNFQNQKIIELLSQPIIYKENQYVHTHFLQIHIKHWYYHEHIDQKGSKYSSDSIQIQKVLKKKTRIKQKNTQPYHEDKYQIILPESFKKYINILLKTAPLRECYKEIVQFVQQVVRVIYSKPKQKNELKKDLNKQKVLQILIKVLTKSLQLSNYHYKSSSIKILTQDSPFFVKQVKRYEKSKKQKQFNFQTSQIYAQLTFNIKQLGVTWIKRISLGFIVIRIFNEKLQILIQDQLKCALIIPSILDQKTYKDLEEKLYYEIRKVLVNLKDVRMLI